MLCRACHKFIHRTLSESEMATSFNTVEALLQQPDIAKFVLWVANKPPGLMVHSEHVRR